MQGQDTDVVIIATNNTSDFYFFMHIKAFLLLSNCERIFARQPNSALRKISEAASYFFLEKASAGSEHLKRTGKTASGSHGESCGMKPIPETLDRRTAEDEEQKAVFARAMATLD